MDIIWFRQDLRLLDNPALQAAAQAGDVLAIYIAEPDCSETTKLGSASRVWLHHTLHDLNHSLNGQLHCFEGNALTVLTELCQQYEVSAVHWNRAYESHRIAQDTQIKKTLTEYGVRATSYNGALLWEPWQVIKQDGTPYRVYTPYRRAASAAPPPRQPVKSTQKITFTSQSISSLTVEQLALLPEHPWHRSVSANWTMTEQGGHALLDDFLSERLATYKTGRDYPAQQQTSRLSPYLHFGQLSPNQVWYASLTYPQNDQRDCFQSELIWREFSYYQLYHFPQLPETNLQTKFDHFPWQWQSEALAAWQKGQTGYPLVDAGMRELWRTGTMHNRVRMVVASFLVKNLLIHWRQGADWFWDCLFDADLASNSANWQWVAGCGLDAAPYFRIFNPVTQSEKFDKTGEYIRRFVPELAKLPDKYLHQPWNAPEEILQASNIVLGDTYPEPTVVLKTSREQALEAWKAIKTVDK